MEVRIDESGRIVVTGTAREWTDVLGYAWRAEEGPAERDVLNCVGRRLEGMARDEETKVEVR